MQNLILNQALTKFDYIVVGAGTAGCLLANRLSRSPQNRVALIEAGGNNLYNPLVRIPVGYLFCIGNPLIDWCYNTTKEPGLNGRSIRYPRGKILGGCSSINGMIYMRGQKNDYDHWAQVLNDPQWTWENCLPDFKKHEDFDGKQNQLHGQKGQWKVTKQRLKYDVLDKLRDAVIQYGVPRTDDFNLGTNHGCGYFQVNQYKGSRWSCADAFLSREVRARPNLKIFTGLEIDKITIEKGKMQGCVAVDPKRQQSVQLSCEKELIVAAGSIGSPMILQRSGIGGSWLQDQKIGKIKVRLEGVGENLMDHLQIRPVYKMSNIPTLNSMVSTFRGIGSIVYEYLRNKSGPLTMAPSQLGAFICSSFQAEWPDLEYHIQPLSLNAFGEPLHPFSAITMSVCNLRPKSRGRVRITNLNLSAAPNLLLNYLTHQEDQKKAAQALRLTRKIISQDLLKPYQPEEYSPGNQYQTDEELVKMAGNIGTSIFHPCGTCKMGKEDDPMAVVDSRLRLRGVEGVRVVDASVMPFIVSGNINSPTLMIAEKASSWILGEK